MLVHLGGDVVVEAREVIAILDARRLRRASGSADRGRGPAWESARSLVVTTSGIHPAPITPVAAARRIGQAARFRGLRNG